ncbi:MAG TPA: CBS domain-containing protein [Saprospiraceae bacterium]|nr:CBS domain-containing protein [Saprospiraceae bacterium]
MKHDHSISGIMTREVVTISPDTSLERVHEIFNTYRFHHLVVVDQDQAVKGIISKSDYHKVRHMMVNTWSGETVVQHLYGDMRARDIMTSHPLKIEPDDSIGLAADIFLSNQLHALPVVEENRLVGIVTAHDLLQHAYKDAP